MSKETIGFIGLGLMGHGMAKNIVEKGYHAGCRRAGATASRSTISSRRGADEAAKPARGRRARDASCFSA